MPIEFHCPECYSQIITPDETAGKQGRCPNCSAIIRIPDGSQPVAGNRDSARPSKPQPAKVINPVGAKPAGDPFKPTGQKTSSEYSETVEKQFGLDKWEEKKEEDGSWGEDTELSYKMRKVVAKEHAQSRLAGPAQSLVICATVNLILVACGVLAIIIYVIYHAQRSMEVDIFWVTLWIIVTAVVMMTSTMIMVGGNHMRKTRSYSMAYTGAVFAMMPLNLLFFLTIPFGVWAMSTLNDPELAEGFKRR